MSLEGAQLGIYRVGAELGRGGMGTVYRATATADGPAGPSGSEVALKVFHAHLVEDERAFERFKREAEIGKRIRHPHVVRTFEVAEGEGEGKPVHFMVMEVIEGQTLADLVRELGTVPDHLVFQIADQVLDALETVHERGIVHRDLKPENVVITPDHRVLLMDLGVARLMEEGNTLTQAGEFVGSLAYAAPEQFMPQEDGVGPRADLYAFGVVLFELVTGQSPFDLSDLTAILQQKLQGEVAPPRTVLAEVDGFLNEVVVTATRSKPSERFASAGEMRKVLAEGEQSEWWRRRTAQVGLPSADRALRRLRLAREAPLVGRADELGALREAWGEARRHGGVLLLTGPTGVGKSRLLYDFVEQVAAAGGPLVAAGRCVGAGGRSYQPFVEALQDLLAPKDGRAALETTLTRTLGDTPGLVSRFAEFLLGGVQPGVEDGLSKDALLSAYARILQRLAGQSPVILAVEDLHLAGAESVELFGHLARAVADHPVLLVGLYSDQEVEEGSPLHELLARPPETARKLAVAPLDRAGTEELVRVVVRRESAVHTLAHPLHERSDGNPFLVLEMLAHLRETGALVPRDDGFELVESVDALAVPETVRDLVGLKLGRLDEEQRETLEAAAVLGYEFDASLLAAVLEEKRIKLLKRLAGLERKHRLLVSSGKSAFRFASHQLFETVYDAITPALRSEYHAIVADTILERLEEDGGAAPEGETAYALLRHLYHAERVREAEPFLEPALDWMAATFHAGYAAPFLEKVADALADAPPSKRFALAMKLWSFYEVLASREDQMRVVELAHALAEEMGDPGPRARVHAYRAGSYWYAGDYEKAGTEARAGLELAREAGDEKWESTCQHTLGVVAYRRGQFAEAADRWRRALEIRRRIGDRRGEASTLQALSLVMPAIGEGDATLETMREALGIWREVGERRGEASMLMNIGNHLVDQARYDEGMAHLRQAIERHRETGALLNEALALTNLGRAQDIVGRIDDARVSWERALQICVHLGNPRGELATRIMLGGALGAYGEHGEARPHLEKAIELAERIGAKDKLVTAHRELGLLLHDTGAGAEAWAHLEKARALDAELGSPASRVLTLGALGKAALAEGDHDRAAGYLAEALPDARRDPAQAPLILSRLARAHHGAGRTEEAGACAAEARERLEAGGEVSREDGPEIHYALSEVEADPGRRAQLLAKARELVERRARHIRNDAYREHFLTRTRLNVTILGGASAPRETRGADG